jgi:hypothetical protein
MLPIWEAIRTPAAPRLGRRIAFCPIHGVNPARRASGLMNADPALFWMDRQKINTLPLKELHARLRHGELKHEDLAAAGRACVAAYPDDPMYL